MCGALHGQEKTVWVFQSVLYYSIVLESLHSMFNCTRILYTSFWSLAVMLLHSQVLLYSIGGAGYYAIFPGTLCKHSFIPRLFRFARRCKGFKAVNVFLEHRGLSECVLGFAAPGALWYFLVLCSLLCLKMMGDDRKQAGSLVMNPWLSGREGFTATTLACHTLKPLRVLWEILAAVVTAL